MMRIQRLSGRVPERCKAFEVGDNFHMALQSIGLADINRGCADLVRGDHDLCARCQQPPMQFVVFCALNGYIGADCLSRRETKSCI